MGAFSIVRQRDERSCERFRAKAEKSFKCQGFTRFQSILGADYCLDIYKNLMGATPSFFQSHEDSGFCAVVGTLIYRGRRGDEAARHVFLDFDGSGIPYAEAIGSYCVILRKFNRLFLWTDQLGTFKTYVSAYGEIWSSSFLATLECGEKNVLHEQSVYEYAFQGTTYGGRTLVRNISLAAPERLYDVEDPDQSTAVSSWISAVEDVGNSDSLERCLRSSRRVFEAIKLAEYPIIDSAISGGFDSRLILAFLLEQEIDARYHVYGDPGCSDVVVAKRIASDLGLTVTHEDKRVNPDRSQEERAHTVHQNFLVFDGAPTDGIFDDGSDADSRRRRAAKGALALNGGGGEIFRNFFYLRDRPHTVDEVVSSFYSQYSASLCTNRFDESRYRDCLRRDILNCLNAESDSLSRQQVEMIYPLFRLRYWMGRNNAVNNRIGWAITPFSEPTVIAEALRIPIAEKNVGKLEAEMIRTINSRLASCPTNYGYNFGTDPPLSSRLKSAAVALRPTWLRRRAYRIKHRLLDADANARFQETVLKSCLPDGFDAMRQYFVTDRIRDHAVLCRVATIEYLVRQGLVTRID